MIYLISWPSKHIRIQVSMKAGLLFLLSCGQNNKNQLVGSGMLSALVQKTPMPSSWQSSLPSSTTRFLDLHWKTEVCPLPVSFVFE